jgi:hypothetical protein
MFRESMVLEAEIRERALYALAYGHQQRSGSSSLPRASMIRLWCDITFGPYCSWIIFLPESSDRRLVGVRRMTWKQDPDMTWCQRQQTGQPTADLGLQHPPPTLSFRQTYVPRQELTPFLDDPTWIARMKARLTPPLLVGVDGTRWGIEHYNARSAETTALEWWGGEAYSPTTELDLWKCAGEYESARDIRELEEVRRLYETLGSYLNAR